MRGREEDGRDASTRRIPLEQTARTLNTRFGLYLSEGQQRGLALGLLVGAVLTSAMLAWGITEAVRRVGR